MQIRLTSQASLLILRRHKTSHFCWSLKLPRESLKLFQISFLLNTSGAKVRSVRKVPTCLTVRMELIVERVVVTSIIGVLEMLSLLLVYLYEGGSLQARIIFKTICL